MIRQYFSILFLVLTAAPTFAQQVVQQPRSSCSLAIAAVDLRFDDPAYTSQCSIWSRSSCTQRSWTGNGTALSMGRERTHATIDGAQATEYPTDYLDDDALDTDGDELVEQTATSAEDAAHPHRSANELNTVDVFRAEAPARSQNSPAQSCTRRGPQVAPGRCTR